MDQRMADKETTAEQKKEFQVVKNQADAYSKDELHAVFQKYQIVSPETKNEGCTSERGGGGHASTACVCFARLLFFSSRVLSSCALPPAFVHARRSSRSRWRST